MAPKVQELTRDQRSTRGKRYKAALADEEADADEAFWNQDFFAEDAVDEDYQEEKVSEDVPDSDFDDEDDDGADDDDEVEEVEERPKKKALKPPGAPSAPRPKAVPKPKPAKREREASEDEEYNVEEDEDDGQPAPKPKKQAREVSPQVFAPPSLRKSTINKSTEARVERQIKKENERKPRKRQAKDDSWRPMSQQELLAEAARTELENMASLKLLLAIEEATKRKAAISKKHYQGPLVKFHTRKLNDTEHTSLRVCNMQYPPPWLRRMRAPAPPPQPRCLVTGMPANYRDPQSGQPYSTVAAFKRLRGQSSAGVEPAATVQAAKATVSAPTAGAGQAQGALQQSAVARGEQTERSKQVLLELQEAATDGSLRPAPPQGPYELPVELMALMVDLRSKLQQGLAA